MWKNPPLQEMNDARLVLVKAEKLDAKLYAPLLFNRAKSAYDSAMYCWQVENNKVFFRRNFDVVKEMALHAQKDANEAGEKAYKLKFESKDKYESQLQIVQSKLAYYTQKLGMVPLNKSQMNDLYRGKLLLQESEIAHAKEDYQWALQKLHLSAEKIDQCISYTSDVLENYFVSFPLWKEWESQAIARSAKNKSVLLLVDKFSRKCYFYKNGVILRSFDVELGKNWIGDKNFFGDMSTPEGKYKIVRKKSNSETGYYKAFLLNFPNEEDKKRFELNAKKMHLHKNASIGNLIEIHGHGGKGADWTKGCIALRNDDMDVLFPFCTLGTEVVILGSTQPLNVLLSKNSP